MINPWGSVNTGNECSIRRLLIAGLVSLLFHSLFLSRFPGSSQTAYVPKIQSKIQATLVVAATTPLELSPPQPSPVTVTHRPLPRPSSSVAAARKPLVQLVLMPSPVQPSEVNPPNVTLDNDVSRISAELAKQNQAPSLPKSGDRQPVQLVDIEFEFFLGLDRQSAGTGRHLYVSDGVKHYGLSVSQTLQKEGAVQSEPWQLDISGDLVPQGLSPSVFQSKGALSERLMALKSLPNDGGQPKVRNGRMPDGILDRQSLLYQFMQNPPVEEGGKILLTDGAKHGEYSYSVTGRETLRIPGLGNVSTMRLLLTSRDSSEILELWLLPDSHFLPAKVRHVDEHGDVTEQLVVSLSFK